MLLEKVTEIPFEEMGNFSYEGKDSLKFFDDLLLIT
jgi:hypothetical protein